MSDITEKIADCIQNNDLINSGDRVLAAVSGGIDSVVLLDVLGRVKPRFDFSLAAIHFDHKLRGRESANDAVFVAELCKSWGIRLFSGEWKNGPDRVTGSIQAAAHRARFEYFDRIMLQNDFNRIALGHHLDDHIETVLMALMKGYGINSLRGIQLKSGNRIHPMMTLSKQEVISYALENKLNWMEDSSNEKPVYLRNQVRLGLLSSTASDSGVLKREILRISDASQSVFGIIEKQVDILLENALARTGKRRLILAIDEILPYFNLLGKFIIRRIFSILECGLFLPANSLKQIEKMCSSQTGSWMEIAGVRISRNRDDLIFEQADIPEIMISVKPDQRYDFENRVFSMNPCPISEVEFVDDPGIEFIDSDSLSGDLHIRNWKEGDSFIPMGMKGSKKLSDYFIDRKIAVFQKKRIPILSDSEKIVWVCGQRLDDRVRVNDTSKNVFKLTYK